MSGISSSTSRQWHEEMGDAEARYMEAVDKIPLKETATKFMADWQLREIYKLYENYAEEQDGLWRS